jgi:hypothetical protein
MVSVYIYIIKQNYLGLKMVELAIKNTDLEGHNEYIRRHISPTIYDQYGCAI